MPADEGQLPHRLELPLIGSTDAVSLDVYAKVCAVLVLQYFAEWRRDLSPVTLAELLRRRLLSPHLLQILYNPAGGEEEGGDGKREGGFREGGYREAIREGLLTSGESEVVFKDVLHVAALLDD